MHLFDFLDTIKDNRKQSHHILSKQAHLLCVSHNFENYKSFTKVDWSQYDEKIASEDFPEDKYYTFHIVKLSYEERYNYWFEKNYEYGMEKNYDKTPDFDNDYYTPTPDVKIIINIYYIAIKADLYYKNNLERILHEGSLDENPRPKYADGTPAHSKYITQVFETYDISKGEFPITTLRNTAVKTGIREIFWIYQKQSNSLDVAHNLGIKWWDDWNIGDKTIGVRYGATIKKYDLMNKLLYDLKNNTYSRRHIISMYQYADLEESDGLFPCAFETLWTPRKVGDNLYLDMTLIQRSQDYIMATYINKSQYTALLMMVCGHLRTEGMNIQPGKFCHLVQNLHIYDRHEDAAKEILDRTSTYKQPYMKLLEDKNFYDYTIEDFEVGNLDGIEKIESPLELAI